MSIGERVRALRTAKHMTLEELGKKIGVTRQTLSRYETGIIDQIPSDKVELLAKALDTTPAYIMGWDDTPPPFVEVALTPAEQEMIEWYREASPEVQAMVRRLAGVDDDA